jgi:acyl-CoA reductase-like NAD-dependent aldehyde dehydrogenase
MPNRHTNEEYKAIADDARLITQAFIDGQFVDSASGKTFETVSPSSGKVLANIAECDSEDVNRAVAAARQAFEDGRWRNMGPVQRKAIMLKWAELIQKNSVELAVLECTDMGKTISDALNADLPATISCFKWFAESIDKIYDEIAPSAPDRVIMMRREPLGVVACVVPWNFPLMMTAWKVAPSLILGNSVILKPAEQSPLTALRLAELAAEAGLPDGVFHVLPGYGPTAGKALGLHEDVDCIGFTGSTEVGKFFLKYSAESNMKQVHIEAGGKSPHIIFADAANLDAASTAAARAIIFNQGETCNAGSRLLVEEPIKDVVLEKIVEFAKAVKIGDPLDPSISMGAIVDETQLKRVLGYIEAGKEAGAEVAFGGERVLANTGGLFVEPTIFNGVKSEMVIAQEEIFGPVLSVIGFKDADDAIKIANDSIYGLYAAVWTTNLNTAFRMVRGVKAGSVNVNTYFGGDTSVPFGGVKQSGFGRDKSLYALDNYSALKSSCIVI